MCVCVCIHTERERRARETEEERESEREREHKYQCSSTEAPRKDLQRRQKQASSSDRLQLLQTSNPILTHNAILSSFKREQGLASSTKKAPFAGTHPLLFVSPAFAERQLVASPRGARRAQGGRSPTPPPTLFRNKVADAEKVLVLQHEHLKCHRGASPQPTSARARQKNSISKDITKRQQHRVAAITRSHVCITGGARRASGSTLAYKLQA